MQGRLNQNRKLWQASKYSKLFDFFNNRLNQFRHQFLSQESAGQVIVGLNLIFKFAVNQLVQFMANSVIKRIVFFPAIALLKTFDFLVTKFAVNKPVIPENELPFAELLKDNLSVFLEEYDNFLKLKKMQNVKDFYKVGRDLQHDDNWKGVPLVLFDYLFTENADLFPKTLQISRQLPGCRAVMFLVVSPGKHVPPHKGVYKGIYRCLFTLRLPENADCWIRVDDMKIYFRPGEAVVFDETYEHEVMNSSPAQRVVLSFDFYRAFPFPISLMNTLIFFLLKNSSFVRNILKEYQKLDKQTFGYFKPDHPTMK